MNFGISREISVDVFKKGDIITAISIEAKSYFDDKNYGLGIDSFYIGVICVDPGFDFFFSKIRKKYNKIRKYLNMM